MKRAIGLTKYFTTSFMVRNILYQLDKLLDKNIKTEKSCFISKKYCLHSLCRG